MNKKTFLIYFLALFVCLPSLQADEDGVWTNFVPKRRSTEQVEEKSVDEPPAQSDTLPNYNEDYKSPNLDVSQRSGSSSELKRKKDKSGYFLNLKHLLRGAKKRILQVDEKLEEEYIYERNEERVDDVRDLYEEGMVLFEQGKEAEAQELWQKAIEITQHPEIQAYLDGQVEAVQREEVVLREDQKRLEKQRVLRAKKAGKIYRKAVEDFEKENWHGARKNFLKVEEIFPNYLATRSYLMLATRQVDPIAYQRLAREYAEKKRLRGDEFLIEETYQKAVLLMKNQAYADAYHLFDAIDLLYGDYKDTDLLIKELQEKLKDSDELKDIAERRLKEKLKTKDKYAKKLARDGKLIDQKYEQAMELLADKKHREAREILEAIDQLSADYKETKTHLVQIESEINDLGSARSYVDQHIHDAQKQMDVEEIVWEDDSPIDQTDLEADVEEQKDMRDDSEESMLKKPSRGFLFWGDDSKKAKSEYERAVGLFEKKQFDKAKEKFEKVESIYPDYEDTRRYLRLIEQENNLAQKVQDDEYRDQAMEQKMSKAQWREKIELKEKTFSRDTKVRAKRLYKEGRLLYKRGQLKEAREKFVELDQMYPDYKSTIQYLSELNQTLGVTNDPDEFPVAEKTVLSQKEILEKIRQEELDFIYESAVSYYKNGIKEQALEQFIEIQAKSPGYRETESYLKLLGETDQSISEVARAPETAVDEMYDPKAIAKLQDEAALFAQELRQEKQNIQAEKEEQQPERRRTLMSFFKPEPKEETTGDSSEKAIEKNIEEIYQMARLAYEQRKYEDSQNQFLKVSKMDPSYKSVQKYLRRLERKLQVISDQPVEEAAPVEVVLIDQPGQQDTETVNMAEQTAAKVEELKAAVQPVVQRKSFQVDHQFVQQAVNQRQMVMEKEAEEKYQQALDFYQNGNTREAKRKFIAVEALSPNYKETRDYLTRIDQGVALTSDWALTRRETTLRPMAKVQTSHQNNTKDSSPRVQHFGTRDSFVDVQHSSQRTDSPVSHFSMPAVSAIHASDIEQVYDQAIRAYDQGDYDLALSKFRQVQNADSNYKSVSAYAKKVQRVLERKMGVDSSMTMTAPSLSDQSADELIFQPVKTEQQVVLDSQVSDVEKTYYEAIKDFDDKNYGDALSKFNQVKSIDPSFKSVDAYVKKVQNMMERSKEKKKEEIRFQEIVQKSEIEDKPEMKSVEVDSVSSKDVDDKKRGLFNLLGRQKKESDEQIEESIEKKKSDLLSRLKKETETEVAIENKNNKEDEKKIKGVQRREVIRDDNNEVEQDKEKIERIRKRARMREREDQERVERFEERHREKTAQDTAQDSEDQESLFKHRKKVAEISDETQGVVEGLEGMDPKMVELSNRLASIDPAQRDEIHTLIRQRQEYLQEERARITKEFEQSLEDLYRKAVKLYKADMHQPAKKLFVEIQRLEPDYKKTENYLAKIEDKTNQIAVVVEDYKEEAESAEKKVHHVRKAMAGFREKSSYSRRDLISEALDQAQNQ